MNVERLRQAYAFMAAQPDSRVNLNLYYFDMCGRGSGSQGCAVGLLAAAHQFDMYIGTESNMASLDLAPDNTIFGHATDMHVFDLDYSESVNLFGSRNASKYDAAYTALSHKELFLKRMELFFAENSIELHELEEVSQTEHKTDIIMI